MIFDNLFQLRREVIRCWFAKDANRQSLGHQLFTCGQEFLVNINSILLALNDLGDYLVLEVLLIAVLLAEFPLSYIHLIF